MNAINREITRQYERRQMAYREIARIEAEIASYDAAIAARIGNDEAIRIFTRASAINAAAVYDREMEIDDINAVIEILETAAADLAEYED